jgi:hypothetical protein
MPLDFLARLSRTVPGRRVCDSENGVSHWLSLAAAHAAKLADQAVSLHWIHPTSAMPPIAARKRTWREVRVGPKPEVMGRAAQFRL